MLRDLLPQRPDLRLILMSATLQTEALVEYFVDTSPSFVEMQGRMFPVQEFFLEHVLDMTGYIQVAVNEDDDTGGVPAMTDDQLEAELARFTGTGAATQPQQQSTAKAHPKMKCVLCGRRDFKDAVELGTHLALCDGGGEDDDKAESNSKGDTTEKGPSFGGAAGNVAQTETSDFMADMAFEEYDVNAEVELEDFDYDFEAQLNRQDDCSSDGAVEAADDNDNAGNEKWDGESPFLKPKEDDADYELIVTKKEEALLQQYQSSHDDEQIDTFLLVEAISYINQSSYGDGAILVFLPGWQEISEVSALLENTPPFSNSSKFYILPLHSGIPSKDQRRVLQRPPPGVRKIVLSTNIAETSLTIDDVSFVIGKEKEKAFKKPLKLLMAHHLYFSPFLCSPLFCA